MPDYLSQLALRIQQPGLAVQPRPVSRFESQRYSARIASEPSVSEKEDEVRPPSAVLTPPETNAGTFSQPVDSRIGHEARAVDSLSEVQPAKNFRRPYPGRSNVAPAIVTSVWSPEITESSVMEDEHPAPLSEQADRRGRIITSTVPPAILTSEWSPETAESPLSEGAPPSDRSEQADQSRRIIRSALPPAIITSVRSPETTEPSIEEVTNSVHRNQQTEQHGRIIQAAVGQAQASRRIDGLEQHFNKAPSDQLARRESAELPGLIPRRDNESRHSIVRGENARREVASHLSIRPRSHREIGMFSEAVEAEPLFGRTAEIATKSGFAPVSRRDEPQPRSGPADPQLRTAYATDAPTIQVTIGRVEIRATVASTPARKTPTHRPAMTLDEYLKQRNGSRA